MYAPKIQCFNTNSPLEEVPQDVPQDKPQANPQDVIPQADADAQVPPRTLLPAILPPGVPLNITEILPAVANRITGIDLGALEGGLGNPAKVFPNKEFARIPTIKGALNFNHKLHKIYYNQGCKACYDNYDIDSEGRHSFVTALAFKAVKFCWTGENCGILDIPRD